MPQEYDVLGGRETRYIAGAMLEVTALTAGALNADIIPATDVSAYRSILLHITGTWSGQFTFQGSNDLTNWVSVNAFGQGTVASVNASNNGIFHVSVQYRYLRVRMTSYTSGTANGIAEFSTLPIPFPIHGVSQVGTWTLGTTATVNSNTEFHRVATADNNAAVVKASAGQVYGVSVYNKAAAAVYVKLYNKATAPTVGTDVPQMVIGVPPSGYRDLRSVTGIPFGTGIGIGIVTGIADSDNTAVAASDCVVDIDYR